MRCQFVRRRQVRRARGFSLLELMVVITIIGLIAGVTSVAVLGALHEAEVKTTRESLRETENLLKLFTLRRGRFPTTEEGLAVLVAEKLVKKVPEDAWKRPLLYTAERDGYSLRSLGSDGQPGGEDHAADLDAKDL